MSPSAAELVRAALAGSGVELVASAGIARYDARAPAPFRSVDLFPPARGVVVAASAGPLLWRRLRALRAGDPSGWDDPDPLDRFVRSILDRADAALSAAGIGFRRFEAAVAAQPRLDFVAIGRLVGMGALGPFGMLIHPVHGPWWALRGAYLVDGGASDDDGAGGPAGGPGAPRDPWSDRTAPCEGCAAPCVGGWANAGGVPIATADVRKRCVVGQASRYDDDQIRYHHRPLEPVPPAPARP